MKVQFEYHQKSYSFETDAPLDISLPIVAGEANPNCYYAEPVKFEVIRAGSFVGSVAEGGSCNYQKVTFTPHGNGTHTECYGHISPEPTATVHNCLQKFWFFAQLITVLPTQVGEDKTIQLADIEPYITLPTEAVIIRTLPNLPEKCTRQYSETNPPYLAEEVGKFLAMQNVQHLLVDLPSVDREVDEGKLLTHRAFWQYPHQIRTNCTITELIYVPDEIPDGYYMLNLQVPSFQLDAVPSKPVLYKNF
jgi:kynurenine formamidase